MTIRLALYQPDIPPNTGTMLRLAACLGVGVDIIEPAGFPWSDRTFRRAGLDYLDHVEIARHADFTGFDVARTVAGRRLVVLSRHGDTPHTMLAFQGDDVLLVGRETSGVPDSVMAAADACVRVPIRQELRSLNVAVAAAMVLGEALRQTDGYAALEDDRT